MIADCNCGSRRCSLICEPGKFLSDFCFGLLGSLNLCFGSPGVFASGVFFGAAPVRKRSSSPLPDGRGFQKNLNSASCLAPLQGRWIRMYSSVRN
jgi:hypothetical protein